MGVRKKTSSHTAGSPGQGAGKSAASRGHLQGRRKAALEHNHEIDPATPQEKICSVVAMIPCGKVATYGQIAALAGMPRHARLVGRTLRELPAGTRLPWFRVVNASLRISTRAGGSENTQRAKLEREGIEFLGERVSSAHRWEASP